MLNPSWKKYIVFILLLCLNSAYAQENDDRFEFSKFFHAKSLAKQALEDVTLKASRYQKTKQLQTALVNDLTGLLWIIKTKYDIDFAVISNEKNNSKELLDKGILFTTIKLKYEDQKGPIMWELTSVLSPNEIDFYSVVDEGNEITENDIYAYKRLYKQ